MGDPNVWVLVPTAMKEHVPVQLAKWRQQGYHVGVLTDWSTAEGKTVPAGAADLVTHVQTYPGVWASWNILAHTALRLGADVCVLAGDDMDPDPNKGAQEIAREYLEKFPDGFGVMQPCGDMQGDLIDGVPNSGRICGSPWVGRNWIRMGYGGNGPVNAMYRAFYSDQELKGYAGKLGRLWMRPDLSQYHRHWSWGHLPRQPYHERNQKDWDHDKELYERREKNGFP